MALALTLPARFTQHVRALWPGGWGLAWLAPFWGWAAVMAARGEFRGEHVVLVVVVPSLMLVGPRSKRLFFGLLPFGILALVYDAMRFVKNAGITPERVHVCDLRALDARLFGVTLNGARVPVQDWLQAHAVPALDLICAVPYGTFLYAALALAIWLYVRDYEGLRRFGWTFLAMNLAGFVTYHLYPAAPPWYFHAHGCAVDLAAHANEGPNLARVDAWLGVRYFAGFYGRSSDVFGAVPSLHVAYPLLSLVYGWRHWRVMMRALAILYFVTMCFAAVYLDHHWVVDVLLGVTYTILVERGVRWLWGRTLEARDNPATALARGAG